jgi:hypothetical protein
VGFSHDFIANLIYVILRKDDKGVSDSDGGRASRMALSLNSMLALAYPFSLFMKQVDPTPIDASELSGCERFW